MQFYSYANVPFFGPGEVVMDGPPNEVMKSYAAEPETGSTVELRNHPNRDPANPPSFQSLTLCDSAGNPTAVFDPGELCKEDTSQIESSHPQSVLSGRHW